MPCTESADPWRDARKFSWNPASSGDRDVGVDAQGGILINASRGVDVDLHVNVPLAGQDLQFFPIEDIQPTYGLTFGGNVEMRY